MAIQRNPFGELGRLFERMGRQFGGTESADSDSFAFDRLQLPAFDVDLVQEDDRFVLRADLPGFDTDDISVRIADTTVHIRADREEASESDDEQFVYRERHHRSLSRSITIPEPIDADAVTATYDDGVLELTIPRAEPAADGQSIEISE